MRRFTFIVNPISGGSDKSGVLAAVGRYLDLSDAAYEVIPTRKAGDGTLLARECASDVVVAVGGDGTVSEVASGLLGTEKVLGIIPCGSGDGLALHLGLSRDPARAVRTLNEGCAATVDVGEMDGKPFFCTAGVGLDADVAALFARSGRRGLGTYISTAWGEWQHREPGRYVVEVDGRSWVGEALFITVGNANQWGNEARIVPRASLRDGLLDVTVVQPFTTMEIPGLAARLMAGKADTSHHVLSLRGAHIHIHRDHSGAAHRDGDPMEAGTDLVMDIRPGALKVLVPESKLGKI